MNATVLRNIRCFAAGLAGVLLVFPATSASACECAWSTPGPPPTEAQLRESYPVVFVAEFVSERKDVTWIDATSFSIRGAWITLRVVRTYPVKGIEPSVREVLVYTGLYAGGCGFEFRQGTRYLVFASTAGGTLSTDICTPTRELRAGE